MMDLRNKIVSLSNQLCSQNDYKQKKRVREHNRAMTKLFALYQTMYDQEGHCESVARELLQHPSEKVQLSVATYCLKAGILDQEARDVLRNIEKNSCDKMLALDASLTAMATFPHLEMSNDPQESDTN